jgi:alpha-1,3-rhamnosyl/mannosyltransferase
VKFLFDARVIQDHFPGIGRYAFNLLAALPAELRAGEQIIVLHDPSAPSLRLPMERLRERQHPQVRWQEWRVPVFGVKNLASRLPHPPANAIAHFPYYMRPATAAMPSLTTIHDALLMVHPEVAASTPARIANRLLNALAIRASQGVIAVSHSGAQDIERFLPAARGKMTVIPEAADPLFAPLSVAAQDEALKPFAIQRPFALFLASNKPHKNLVRLVEAWALAMGDWKSGIGNARATDPQSPISNPEFPLLLIAGHVDPRYPQAQQRVKALGLEQQVRFIGVVSDAQAAALYSACGLFVFPSLYEGFGLTPLEAMACGAPVVCSNTSAMPEVAGEAALLFDPTAPAEIAQACLRVLRDGALRASMRERSLKQAATFSWQKTAQLTIDAYRSLTQDA